LIEPTSSELPTDMPTNPRPLNWLFFNPVNVDSLVYRLYVPTYPLDPADQTAGELEWVDALKSRFGFKADPSTIRFWGVNG
jgi:hypothetical protein